MYDPWRCRCVRDVMYTAHIAAGHVTPALLYKERSSVTTLSSLMASLVRRVVLSLRCADDAIFAWGRTLCTIHGGLDASET